MILDQMQRAGLESKPNLFADVQDFTPDISQLQVHNEKVSLDLNTLLSGIDINPIIEQEKITFSRVF